MADWWLLGVVGLAIIARVLAGTWLHPSAIFAAAWSVYLAIPMAAIPNVEPAPMAGFIVFISSLGVVAAAVLAPSRDASTLVVAGGGRLVKLVWGGAAAGCFAALLTQRANSISISDMLSLDSIATASREVTLLRYSGDLVTPIAATGLLALMYSAALMAPFAGVAYNGWRRWATLAAPGVGGTLYALMTTARAPFLIAVMITTAAALMLKAVEAGGRPRVAMRSVAVGLAGITAVAFVFTFVAANRMGGWSPTLLPDLVARIALYSGGGVPAYDQWLGASSAAPRFGVETFAGIGQFVLLDPSLGSAYDDYAAVAPGLETNVYTVLRPLTEDFGIAGAVLFLAVGGTWAAGAYRVAIVQRSLLAMSMCVAWVAFTLFSMTTSIWTFANVVTGFVLGAVLICRHLQIVNSEGATEGFPSSESESGGDAAEASGAHADPGSLDEDP